VRVNERRGRVALCQVAGLRDAFVFACAKDGTSSADFVGGKWGGRSVARIHFPPQENGTPVSILDFKNDAA